MSNSPTFISLPHLPIHFSLYDLPFSSLLTYHLPSFLSLIAFLTFRVLVHVVRGDSEDPVGDFIAINQELELFNPKLALKTQVRTVQNSTFISITSSFLSLYFMTLLTLHDRFFIISSSSLILLILLSFLPSFSYLPFSYSSY
jgi:hypothetical protein